MLATLVAYEQGRGDTMADARHVFNDALALEYQGSYGGARRDLNVFDLVNDPGANGVCRVFGLSLEEEGLDLVSGKCGALFDDRANPFLVRLHAVEPLA
jgi:hypothetical protein